MSCEYPQIPHTCCAEQSRLVTHEPKSVTFSKPDLALSERRSAYDRLSTTYHTASCIFDWPAL